jgi:hypothetical protein
MRATAHGVQLASTSLDQVCAYPSLASPPVECNPWTTLRLPSVVGRDGEALADPVVRSLSQRVKDTETDSTRSNLPTRVAYMNEPKTWTSFAQTIHVMLAMLMFRFVRACPPSVVSCIQTMTRAWGRSDRGGQLHMVCGRQVSDWGGSGG